MDKNQKRTYMKNYEELFRFSYEVDSKTSWVNDIRQLEKFPRLGNSFARFFKLYDSPYKIGSPIKVDSPYKMNLTPSSYFLEHPNENLADIIMKKSSEKGVNLIEGNKVIVVIYVNPPPGGEVSKYQTHIHKYLVFGGVIKDVGQIICSIADRSPINHRGDPLEQGSMDVSVGILIPDRSSSVEENVAE